MKLSGCFPRALIYIVFAISILLLALSANQFFIENITSDFLHGYEGAANIILNKSIVGQDFPAAPYFFPDLLVIGLLEFFTHNVAILHFIYSILFLTAYLALVYALIKASGVSKNLSLFGTLIAFLSFFLIIPNQLWFLKEWPLSHFSVILFSLFFLVCYIKSGTRALRLSSVVGLLIVGYLVYISDNLLFVQFLLPFSVILIADVYFKNRNKKTLWFLLIFLVVVFLGAKTPDFLADYFGASFSMTMSMFRIRHFAQTGHTISHFFELLNAQIHTAPIFYTILLFYNLAVFGFAIVLYKKSKNSICNVFRILGFLYLSQLVNLVLAVISGKIGDVANFRYFGALYFFPSIALGLLVVHLLDAKIAVKFLLGMISVIVAVSCVLFINNNYALIKDTNFAMPYDSSIQCMDDLQAKYHLQNGIAFYWNVRPLRMLSKTGIKMSQVEANLDFINQVDNEIFFYADKEHTKPLDYQFMIVNDLPKDKIRQTIGGPDKIEMCGAKEVWLFVSKQGHAKLNQYFGVKLEAFRRRPAA